MSILKLVADNDHESNGLVENRNRTLCLFYNRIRQCYRWSANEIILREAQFEKLLSRGSNKSLVVKLLHVGSPTIILKVIEQRSPSISIEEHAQHVTRKQINKTLHAPIRTDDQIAVEDNFSIWRVPYE